jgi:hypothetical protein
MIKNKIVAINILLFGLTIIFVLFSFFSKPFIKSFVLRSGEMENAEAFKQQFIITFSRPMNKDSVVSNFFIDPAIDGNFSWAQDTLFFTPESTLKYGQVYEIRISNQALDIYGKQLSREFNREIKTKPYQYIFIGNDNRLILGSMSGGQTDLAPDRKVAKYYYSREAKSIIYIVKQEYQTDTEIYYIDDLNTPKSQLILDNYKNVRNLAFSANGKNLYFQADVPAEEADGKSGTKKIINQKLFMYSVPEQAVKEVILPEALSNFRRYWLANSDEAFIFNSFDNAYYLKLINDNSQVLLGDYGDYGGSNLMVDKFVFTNKRYADYDSGIIFFDGQAKIINQAEEIGALPSINDDGALVSYSYVLKSYLTKAKLANYNVRVVDVETGKTTFTTLGENIGFMESNFSPDSKYLTVEKDEKQSDIHYVSDNYGDHIYYPIKDEPDYWDDKITTIFYDLSIGKKTNKIVDGYDLQWIY